MSHTFRFHAARSAEGLWSLDAEEWHHLLKVLRLTPGSSIELANGQGWTARATLLKAGKSQGELGIEGESFEEARPPAQRVYLALGAIKPQSVDDTLPSVIELGIDGIFVFPFAGMAKSRLSEKVRERWQRVLASAAKQCKRAWWPEIVWLESFEDFLAMSESIPHRLVLDAAGEQAINAWQPSTSGAVLATIGSEKGLSPAELAQLQSAGFISVRMQGSVLRAITASIAATTLLRHHPHFQ